MLTGNRGILRFDGDRLTSSRWTHPHWIICTLEHPRGKYQSPQPKRGWVPLFFLDEAVGLAAGHRPCHYCRRADAARFMAAWHKGHGRALGSVLTPEVDKCLHAARVTRTRQQIRHQAKAQALPDGAFVLLAGGHPALIFGDAAHPYTPSGYGPPIVRPTGTVTVLTPEPILPVLSAGYLPQLHASVQQ
jgi:hypothetical protein